MKQSSTVSAVVLSQRELLFYETMLSNKSLQNRGNLSMFKTIFDLGSQQMKTPLVTDKSLRKVSLYFATCAFVGLSAIPAAQATVTEALTSSSSYTYDFAPGNAGSFSGVGDTITLTDIGSDADLATEVKLNNQTLVADDASFFFLKNIQCKGFCSVSATTQIVNTITNTGSVFTGLELISNITPGHFGLVQNAETDSSGSFVFEITQDIGGISKLLYSARGEVSSLGAFITTSDGSVFNGLKAYNDPSQIGLDWDATDLSVFLNPLAPGATTTVTYSAKTVLNSYGICADVTLCDGVQVAFGDPRNTGGIIPSRAAFSTLGRDVLEPVGFVLDRGFDKARLRLTVVETPAVPEPASWAMLICGFGIAGAALRRSRVRSGRARFVASPR